MLTAYLIQTLRNLAKPEKLQALQLLINDLIIEEAISTELVLRYEIFTPYGNEFAAQTLAEYLETGSESDRQ